MKMVEECLKLVVCNEQIGGSILSNAYAASQIGGVQEVIVREITQCKLKLIVFVQQTSKRGNIHRV